MPGQSSTGSAEEAKQGAEMGRNWAWIEAGVWTERMLSALGNGVKSECRAVRASHRLAISETVSMKKPPTGEKLWDVRRRSWHLHRPYELMEVAPWPKLTISAEA
jgi:hypothetical protein